MDRLILAEKIEALRRCVTRIEQRRAATPEELQRDFDRQDVLSLNLTRAVQICVDVAMHLLADTDAPAPRTMGEAFAALAAQSLISGPQSKRLRAVVSFRNIVVHSCPSKHRMDCFVAARLAMTQ